METETPTKTKRPSSSSKKSLGNSIQPDSQVDLVNSTKSVMKKVVTLYIDKDLLVEKRAKNEKAMIQCDSWQVQYNLCRFMVSL